MTENTDYTLQWNANYTRLEITLKDGSQKYFISYDTTTPNDGSKVANYISVTKEDGTKVTQRSNNTRTDMTAAATSLYSGTIVASTAYMIKINKVDEFSMAPLQGAVFTVTAADGSVAPQEITTDSNGAALTLAYNPSMVGKTFIIKEKTAPTGYQLDPTEYRVVLGSGGSVLNLKNTPVHALVNVTARKELSGRTLQDQEFTFKLYDANGNEVGEAKNDATGAIVFSGVKLSGTGTYQYSIGEVDTQNGGVTFDLERKYVTIEVIRGADGMLKATVTSQPVVFTNSYTVSPAKVSVTAQKNLTGRDLKDREFSFELYDAAGGLVATGHNDTNGLITFPDFTLDTVGTYTFTMKEVVGTLGGMTYDTTEYPVTVEVSDNQQGQLVATVTSPSPIFTNHYKAAAASVTLSATKTLTGRTLKANEFEFVLTNQDDQEVGRATNTENGAVTFAPITITEAGTYTYTISEVKGNLGGVTYDDSTVKATVVVTDNEEGALEAAVTYENNDQTFENTYSASPVKVKIPAVKRLDGRDLKAEEFEFQLKDDATQTVVETVKNTADGQINFTELTFNTVGEYTYTISEVQGNLGGVQYDTTDVKATISVTDNGQGQLQAALAFEDGDNGFENSYSAAPGAATLSANKVLHGRDLKADEFEFVLKNQDGQEVERVKNLANGDVNFSALTFTKEGTYTYTISEVQGNLGGVLYDGTDVKATVTVTDNGQGQLVTSIVYENDDQTFENRYSASQTSVQLTAKKVLEGRELNADEFEFVLSAENGPEIETVKNAADGSVTFAPITYTQAGAYTYTISEKEAGLEGITYDKTTARVTVEVVDNGQGQLVATVTSAVPTFKNIYVEPTTTTTTIPTTSTTVTTNEVTTTEITSVEPTVTTTGSTSADTTVTSEATTSKSTTEEPLTTVATTSTVTTTEEPPVSTTEMTSESTEGSTTVTSESSTTDARTSEGTTTSASTTSGDLTTVATTSEESTTSAFTTTLPVSTATTTAEPTTTTDDPATTTGTTTGGRTTADGQTPPVNGGNPPSKQVLPSTGESTSLWMFIAGFIVLTGTVLGYFFHRQDA